MLLLEIKPRRKHLTALLFSEDISEDLDCRRDSTGLPVIDSDLCDELKLKSNIEISEDEFLNIAEESERRRAKSKAMWLLARQDMCSGQLYKKLKKDFPEPAAAFAVARVLELGLINDEEYAGRLAESLINEKGTAPRQAAYLMAQKGVDRELAKMIIAEREDDPRVPLKNLVEKKYIRKLSNETDIKRTVAALQRKGFSYSDIRAVIDELTNNYLGDSEFVDF